VLALAGIVGPLLFAVGFLLQGFLRTDLRNGYNPIAQQISDLTAGPFGWVQQVNFVVFGLLLIAFAVGFHLGRGKTWPSAIGAALVAWNGVELVIAGIFPLREDSTGSIFDPLGVHSVNGTIFFLCIGVVLGVLSLQLAHDERWRDRSAYTLISGVVVVVLVLLNGLLAESVQAPLHPWLGLIQRAVLAVWFPCLIVLALRLWHLARDRRGSQR
jgi:surface polysaccharide O-acyltransferase-like enzyme